MAGGKILVVRPSDASTTVPLFCPLCQFPLKTSSDSIAYRKALCCDKCILFCRGNPKVVPEEEWLAYLEERQNSPKPLFILR